MQKQNQRKRKGNTKTRSSRHSFSRRVLSVVSHIPRGRTLTYKQVAQKAGSPYAFRAVGNVLNKNYDPKIPCHRVICSDGNVGGYNRGSRRKAELLHEENAIRV